MLSCESTDMTHSGLWNEVPEKCSLRLKLCDVLVSRSSHGEGHCALMSLPGSLSSWLQRFSYKIHFANPKG